MASDASARVREALQRALREMPTSARIIASMYLAPRVLAAIRAAAGLGIAYSVQHEQAIVDRALRALSSGEAEGET
jgi:hypothetical protein